MEGFNTFSTNYLKIIILLQVFLADLIYNKHRREFKELHY